MTGFTAQDRRNFTNFTEGMMELLRILRISLCLTALGAFGWGMTRFFRKTTRSNAYTNLVGAAALASAVWHVGAVISADTEPRTSITATVLYALSLALFLWAVRTCRSQRRTLTAIFETDTPDHLLQTGPFRLVRHPFYSAYALFWLAGSVASGSWLSLASATIMAGTYVWGAMSEETKFRASRLANEHADYCRRTGFMFPRVNLCLPFLRRALRISLVCSREEPRD
jgi:protein-S-isoprenylcysteine O-methyltransferase Ste14